ncbi:MAG: VOC family protein [Polymorphobacter sp.]|uniref:VOC family protein n=1 Tax=Polymorphobacter sp. TaxID=1909290 RepID=UPI003A87AE7D
MIGYVTLGTNDLARAEAFVLAVLGLMGAQKLFPMPQGGSIWGRSMDEPLLAMCPPFDGKPATAGNGTMVALMAANRAEVDAVHARAMAAGGSDEGAPGLRDAEAVPDDDPMAFYGAYFRDPDGNKFCAFHLGPG